MVYTPRGVKTLDPTWHVALGDEFSKPYFRELAAFLKEERQRATVYPPPTQLFTAFRATPYDKANVVILGQDPYHGERQAHGLSFSVLPGVPPPPSLKNIYKELEQDVGFRKPKHGYLMAWAEQGVFLLNSVLTVRAQQPGSHRNRGWETFTDQVIETLNIRDAPVVFVLWGRHAREKLRLIDTNRHAVVESTHPSPMSAAQGFFGSRPFSQVNDYLEALEHPLIDWQLPDEPT
jgi:uracil-DNA glycosylase